MLLIEWQNWQPLLHLHRHGKVLDVGRLGEGGLKQESTNKLCKLWLRQYDSMGGFGKTHQS